MADSHPRRPTRIMPLLIDGYNLLHVTGILGRNVGPGSLERARQVLLKFLAKSLDAGDRDATTIVFDAANAPWGATTAQQFRGLQIRYAVGYEDADALLEELIRADSAPRRLTVVSSDHRIQRAARRRRATAIDSDVWFEQLRRDRSERSPAPPPREAKPELPATDKEIERWTEIFGQDSPQAGNKAAADAPATDPGTRSTEPNADLPADDSATGPYDPFPPGYGEDLLRDE